ncbi:MULTISPECIES: Tm-1-like ATP-binding domain-containing protein [unclassified Chelatococcus]|uniref:Tm-1-like ATP-binding domain-containing protein n=1 Tax=unclassified Chelatococcus TaxID=2638111 RepID=UPI001BD1181E|nr:MULTISPECIES: Tm-1-like ATP-binding domain-containing protein [unclassified Chelatococcus]MBS7699721.1 Tm-1-like ATP-binding domain-containing protein [Chelatococcus sp. YT9]MBX3557081.1 Tm-1-like ATP-binding domain-containing protein [Chelatococcus sp.]
MGTAAVVIAGTLDTKSEEIGYVRSALEKRGRRVIVIDCGILGRPTLAADFPREVVATAGGGDLAALIAKRDREAALPVMIAGLENILRELLAKDEVGGFLGIGGGTNAALAAAAFRLMPFGLPKMLVSTVACGNTRPFVGIKDALLFHSVVDILGLNTFLRSILHRAVAAMDAMLALDSATSARSGRGCVGLTSFGSTTEGAEHALAILQSQGLEVLGFHARGVGGEAMEALIREERIDAVLDLTTTEVADELVGGICSAGPNRLEAAGERGLPQVILPGAVDMVNFGPRTTVPERFHHRSFVSHTPLATLMRTTPAENVEIARFIARKLNAARGPVAVVLPLGGFSAYDRKDGPFWAPAADDAFRSTIRAELASHVPVIDVDAHINDRVTIEAATSLLIDMINTKKNEARP